MWHPLKRRTLSFVLIQKNHTTEEIPISVDKPQKCKLILNKEEREIEIKIIGRKIWKDSINMILSGDYLNDEVMMYFVT